MTIRRGASVVVYDPDLQDAYLAEALHDIDVPPNRNPLVRITHVLSYPIQHAIIYPDVLHENVPIQGGEICRLTLMRAATDADKHSFDGYEDSLHKAQYAAYSLACKDGRAAEAEIIKRHMRGEYGARRTLCRA